MEIESPQDEHERKRAEAYEAEELGRKILEDEEMYPGQRAEKANSGKPRFD